MKADAHCGKRKVREGEGYCECQGKDRLRLLYYRKSLFSEQNGEALELFCVLLIWKGKVQSDPCLLGRDCKGYCRNKNTKEATAIRNLREINDRGQCHGSSRFCLSNSFIFMKVHMKITFIHFYNPWD